MQLLCSHRSASVRLRLLLPPLSSLASALPFLLTQILPFDPSFPKMPQATAGLDSRGAGLPWAGDLHSLEGEQAPRSCCNERPQAGGFNNIQSRYSGGQSTNQGVGRPSLALEVLGEVSRLFQLLVAADSPWP